MIRPGVAAAIAVLGLAACGTSDEEASEPPARAHTAAEVSAALGRHGVKSTRLRLDRDDCADGERGGAYEVGEGDTFEGVVVSCTAFVIAGDDESAPVPSHVVTPHGRRFVVLVYGTATDAERVEAADGKEELSRTVGAPVDYLRRDNVLVICAGCGDERSVAQAALDDL